MKSIFKIITAGFLIVVILISTMGFSVNTMYCLCLGQYEVSLFKIDDKCKKEETVDIEIANMPPCCQKVMTCHEPVKEHKDCSKHEKKYVKADLKFLEFQKTELPKAPVFDVLVSFYHNFYLTSKITFLSEIQPLVADRAPPQYYGRKLLNFIQIYRC